MATMQMADLIFLGEAGTTEVYAAAVGEKAIALKKIKPANQGDRRLRRLLPVLASSWSHQSHDHLARIYKVDGEAVQILMEKFEANLTELEPNEANVTLVIRQCLAGLDHLHCQGLLHLNIKPANILRSTDQTVKLADGLCCEPGANASRGANPNYRFFAPEQFTGAGNVDYSTDLYSLGMAIIDWLASQELDRYISEQLSTGSGHSILWADWASRYDIPNPSVKTLRPELSQPLVDILDRLLQKNPTDRFRSTFDAIDEVKRTQGSGNANLKDSSRSSQSASSAKKVQIEKDWTTGIELALLTGAQSGETHFAKNNFQVGVAEAMQLQLATEDYSDIGDQAFSFTRNGNRWEFSVEPPNPFLLNGKVTNKAIDVSDGDILRLGPDGPDLLIRRSHTEPKQLLSICQSIIDNDKIRSSLNASKPEEQESQSKRASKTPQLKNPSNRQSQPPQKPVSRNAPPKDEAMATSGSLLANPIVMGLAIALVAILAAIYFIF